MKLDELIEQLCNAAAYPDEVSAVDVRQTHTSVVFLTDQHAYKIRKPVALGFLDFTTLEKRRHDCLEEVRLNRRLAADVYLDVVPVAATADGRVQMEGSGPVREWAVKMRRLPDEATLEQRLARHEDVRGLVRSLADRLATFHASADRGAHVSQFGRYDVVARNALENFEQAAAQVGGAISSAVLRYLQSLTREVLARLRPTIEARADRGLPCDTHGDLRPGHVYFFPDRQPPADILVVDCIEFNERFRYADPIADMAFLVMGLVRAGHADLAADFAEAYFEAAGDAEGRDLLPFYVSYRAAVRGKVDGMLAADQEVPQHDRDVALSKARGFWLVAMGALAPAGRRPCMILIAGLPGTGKSTLAADLAGPADLEVLRSDVVRKELAGEDVSTSRADDYEQGLYSPEWNERTYAELLRQTECRLFEGRRVAVDASFRDEAQRQRFIEAAVRWGVPVVLFVCQTDADVIRARLAGRTGDASDADWSVYREAAADWDEAGALTRRALVSIDTAGPREQSLRTAMDVLKQRGVAD